MTRQQYDVAVGGSGAGGGISRSLPGWGSALKRGIREEHGSAVSLRGYGERVPRRHRSSEIAPSPAGLLGILQVRFHAGHDDSDRKMMEDMYGWMERILRACDAEIVTRAKYLEAMGDA